MVDADLAARKIARAEHQLSRAEDPLRRRAAEILDDEDLRDLATFRLFLAIQECIDLAAHWVADEGLGTPEDIASTFDLLQSRGRLDPDLAAGMRAAVGLRNRIAHGYATVDHRRLLDELEEGAGNLRRFLAAVAAAAGL